jgi:hypothetical protein
MQRNREISFFTKLSVFLFSEFMVAVKTWFLRRAFTHERLVGIEESRGKPRGMHSRLRFKKQILNHATGSTPINAEVADFPGFF